MNTVADEAELGPENEGRQRQPLARGIELLTFMIETEQDTFGVRELAGQLGVSPSTAHRLVTDLEKLGLVRRAENGAYRLGLEMLRLAWTTTERFPLGDMSADTVRDLVEKSGESGFLALYSEQRHQMMFTLTVESPHPLRYALPLRQWLPLHAGASGLAILAYLPQKVQEAIARGPLAAQTERTVVEPDALIERLATIRKEGYAITHGERIEGAVAIASPVFGPYGTVIAAAGLSIPESRFHEADAMTFETLVQQAAARISQGLSTRGAR